MVNIVFVTDNKNQIIRSCSEPSNYNQSFGFEEHAFTYCKFYTEIYIFNSFNCYINICYEYFL